MKCPSFTQFKYHLNFIIVGLLFAGCTYPKPMLVSNATCTQPKDLKTRSLTLLEPVVIFDSATIKIPSPEDLAEAKKAIREYLQQGLTSRGFTVVDESHLEQSKQGQIEQTKTMLKNAGILFKPQKRCRQLGKHWNYLSNEGLLIFTGVRAAGTTMVGERPLGGSIGLGSKVRSNVFVSIIDPKESQIFWLKESFSRSRPLGADWSMAAFDDGSNLSAIRESLDIILSEFPTPKR